MADFESLLLADATQRGHDGVICGHIHNAVLRETIRDGRPLLYANCGDWIEKPTALVEHADGRLELLDVEALLREHALEPAGSDLEPIASEVEC
jgi:UDP-2,3-diacylglucosamine pyrophosphatase LpxH